MGNSIVLVFVSEVMTSQGGNLLIAFNVPFLSFGLKCVLIRHKFVRTISNIVMLNIFIMNNT